MGGRSGHRRDITPGQGRLVTARFVLRQLLFFFFSFLAEVPRRSDGSWEKTKYCGREGSSTRKRFLNMKRFRCERCKEVCSGLFRPLGVIRALRRLFLGKRGSARMQKGPSWLEKWSAISGKAVHKPARCPWTSPYGRENDILYCPRMVHPEPHCTVNKGRISGLLSYIFCRQAIHSGGKDDET